MTPKTIISKLENLTTITMREALTGKSPVSWENHCVYLVHDREVVLYVGKTNQSAIHTRMLGHIGQHPPMKKSRLGELYEVNETKANRWCVVLLTVDDCNCLLEKCGGEHRVRKINTAEKALIKLCWSCLNTMSNDDPTPLPKHYKRPDSWLAGT